MVIITAIPRVFLLKKLQINLYFLKNRCYNRANSNRTTIRSNGSSDEMIFIGKSF